MKHINNRFMSININILQNGSEEIYTSCSPNQNKDADDIAMLIAASRVSGEKHLFTVNEIRIANLIEQFKINLDNYEITKIDWLDDVTNKIWEFKDSSVFIFDYFRLRSKPDFSEPSSPITDHESELIFAEIDQKEIKKVFHNWGAINNLVFYIPEYEKPISEQIQDASGKYTLISYSKGKKKVRDFFAGPLGRHYHRPWVEKRANEKQIEIAIKSSNEVSIIYPSVDEEELWAHATVNPSLDLKKYGELKILSTFIYGHFNSKNLANEKVKYPNPIDENGDPIPDHLLSAYDAKLAEEGIKRYIPTKKEIEKKNSLTAINRYIECKDSSLLLDDNIVREIDILLSDRINNKKVEFIAASRNVFALNRTIFSLAKNKDIFILSFNSFTENGFEHDEYEELRAWACFNKRNLTYSVINRFKVPYS